MTLQITVGGAIAFVVLGFILNSLRGAASSVLADEFKASAPALSRWIVRWAARCLPGDHREDQLETWFAELHELQNRPLAALKYAMVNCLMAAPFLARQLQPSLRPAPQATGEVARGSDVARSSMRRLLEHIRLRPIDRKAVGLGFFTRFTALLAAVVALAMGLLGRVGSLRSMTRLTVVFVEFINAVLAPIGRLGRSVGQLFGPYDYSREWRSVLQLMVKIARSIAMIGAVFPAAIVAGRLLFGL